MPCVEGECADLPEKLGEQRRSLEEALASVLEGDGVLYAGDGMKLLVKPSTVDVAHARRRRRRSGRSRERALTYTTAVRHPDEVVIPVALSEDEIAEQPEPQVMKGVSAEEARNIADVIEASMAEVRSPDVLEDSIEDRALSEGLESAESDPALGRNVPVALFADDDQEDAESFVAASNPVDSAAGTFRVVPVPVRFAEHARSPFVVSLRGLALSAEPLAEEECLSQGDILAYDIDPSGSMANLDVLRSLARDLSVDEADGVKYSEQFTPSMFAASYASAYGPFTKFFDRIGMYLDRVVGTLKRPSRRSADRREALREVIDAAAAIDASDPRHGIAYRPPYVRVPVGRTVVVMGALAFVAMLPANVVRLARTLEAKRADVANAGTNAIGDLQQAASTDLATSVSALRRASEGFRAADESLSSTNALALALANVIPQARESYASARALLEVGQKTSDAGRLLAKGLDAALSGQSRGLLDRLGVLSAYADGALPLLNDASRALGSVDAKAIPESERNKIGMLRDALETGRLAVREFVGASELLAQLLGRDEPKRFLIVFQNPNEIRPTGGFMGSYAELDVDRGAIERLSIPGGGTYDLQGQLVKQIIPPEPLRLVADRWEFQDANWSPDFSASAAKIREIWSASGGYTVDGVIAVNATVVADLIAITGPIDVPELGKTLTAENAIAEIEKSAEIEYDRVENKPKKILSLAGPRLIEKLKALPPEGLVNALTVFSDAIVRKEIQVALTDPDEDALARGFGWSGELKETFGDSLAVINANIAGGKTDAVMSEAIAHAAVIGIDGSITDTVEITRTHHGIKRTPLTGVRNVEYIRIFVPRGSALVSAEGFATSPRALVQDAREDAVEDPDLAAVAATQKSFPGAVLQWDEGNRTVIGGWSTVDPGETIVLKVVYRLPFSAFDIQSRLSSGAADADGGRAAYSLLLTSQSGMRHRTVFSTVAVPSAWSAAWSRNLDAAPIAWDRDRVISSLYDTSRP